MQPTRLELIQKLSVGLRARLERGTGILPCFFVLVIVIELERTSGS